MKQRDDESDQYCQNIEAQFDRQDYRIGDPVRNLLQQGQQKKAGRLWNSRAVFHVIVACCENHENQKPGRIQDLIQRWLCPNEESASGQTKPESESHKMRPLDGEMKPGKPAGKQLRVDVLRDFVRENRNSGVE